MTCRHRPGDPSCSSSGRWDRDTEEITRLKKQIDEQAALLKQPDNTQFEIIDAIPVGTSLVLKVRYENCAKCSYEGTKVLVYRETSLRDVLKWKVIDPHFSDKKPLPRHAPSPAARFPASEQGFEHALDFAKALSDSKEKKK